MITFIVPQQKIQYVQLSQVKLQILHEITSVAKLGINLYFSLQHHSPLEF